MYNLGIRVVKTVWNKWDKSNWIFAVHNSIIPINNLQNGFFSYLRTSIQTTYHSVRGTSKCPIACSRLSNCHQIYIRDQLHFRNFTENRITPDISSIFAWIFLSYDYERRVEHPNSRICVADEWWEIWAPSPVLSCPVLAGAWNCVNSISSLELTTGQNATHCAGTLH